MSSVLNKLSFLQSRGRRILFFFLLFWLLCGTFLFFHTLSLKHQIQQQRIENVKSTLHEYLENSRGSAGTHFRLENDLPDKLDFIRLVKGRDQLLITGNSHMDFSGLVDLPPSQEGIWVDLQHPEKTGDWLLVYEKLDNGGSAQAGKNDRSTGRVIYIKSVTAAWSLFFFGGPAALGLAFLCNRLMRQPLQQLQSDMQTGLKRKAPALPADREKDSDLAPIYHLLEQIFLQNRQLIHEMQSSLDNVAHDLRTPMTRLRAVAEYALQSETNDPQLYRGALSDCLEESDRVLSMLRVMMSVAEAESGTMRLALEKVDVFKTLKEVVELYQYVAEEEQITVSCKGESGLLIKADKTRISQVWANLLDNAIKYGHEAGNVTIEAAESDGEATIRFRDDGMGISENEINRIWERLYRGDRSRSKQGLGLGLNYVKAVVEAHGGRVSVTSSLREGSCFEVRLPLLH